jgi:hypothetical protein
VGLGIHLALRSLLASRAGQIPASGDSRPLRRSPPRSSAEVLVGSKDAAEPVMQGILTLHSAEISPLASDGTGRGMRGAYDPPFVVKEPPGQTPAEIRCHEWRTAFEELDLRLSTGVASAWSRFAWHLRHRAPPAGCWLFRQPRSWWGSARWRRLFIRTSTPTPACVGGAALLGSANDRFGLDASRFGN